jgi:hypothetical protein
MTEENDSDLWVYQGERWEYAAVLRGAEIDLKMLAHCFSSGITRVVLIEGEPPLYELRSVEFGLEPRWERRVTTDGQAIRLNANWQFVGERSESFLRAMNGAARLARSAFEPVMIEGLHCYDDAGSRCGAATWKLGVSREFRTYSFPTERRGLAGLVRKWAALAGDDAAVSEALHVYGAFPVTWSSLWLIFEIIANDVGGQAELKKQPWTNEKEIRRFAGSANHARTIHEGIRHAGGVDPKWNPSRGMDLGLARVFITNLLNEWLGSKIGYFMT